MSQHRTRPSNGAGCRGGEPAVRPPRGPGPRLGQDSCRVALAAPAHSAANRGEARGHDLFGVLGESQRRFATEKRARPLPPRVTRAYWDLTLPTAARVTPTTAAEKEDDDKDDEDRRGAHVAPPLVLFSEQPVCRSPDTDAGPSWTSQRSGGTMRALPIHRTQEGNEGGEVVLHRNLWCEPSRHAGHPGPASSSPLLRPKAQRALLSHPYHLSSAKPARTHRPASL
jgi:hypothetical protein